MPQITSPTRGFTGYSPDLEPEISQFLQAAWPDRDSDLMLRRWRWQYLDSASRFGIDPLVCMYRKDGIVAHQGIIPVRAKIGSVERLTGWFVETMVLECERGKTIGPMLIKKALETLPFNLSLGQTEQMRSIQYALGWTEVGPLRTWFYPLHPLRILQQRFASPVVRALSAAALAGTSRLRSLASGGSPNKPVAIQRIDRFDKRFDQFWRRMSNELTCSVVRDADFMNWKFVDQPGQDFLRLGFSYNGELLASAVIAFLEPNEVYSYRRAFIVDLLLERIDVPASLQVLHEIIKTCRERHADAVIVDIVDPFAESLLQQFGFLPRPPQRSLLLSRGDLSPNESGMITRHDQWFLTRADSDIDRPWRS